MTSTKFFTTFAILIILYGCGPSQEEYQKLEDKNKKILAELNDLKSELDSKNLELDKTNKNLEQCTLTVKELQNTSTERLARARSLQSENNISEAEKEYKDLIEKYPDSEESKTAKEILAGIEKQREEERIAKEKEQAEAERKKRLGFKALKIENPVSIDPLSIKINSVNIQKRWISDRYNSRYHYRDARRGHKFIV